jgi:predicted lipid-binding transport protein (Tim44 family)
MTLTWRPLLAVLGLLSALAMVTVDADARPKISAGSRGSRTQSAPPPTSTAPTTAAPIQRTTTPTAPTAARPAAAPNTGAAPAKPGFFNRPGIMGGLAAGLLGAGLFGLLAGQGLFGNMAGIASFIGLLLQIALIGGIVYFALRWFRSRNQTQQPAFAGGPQEGPSQARFDAVTQPQAQQQPMQNAQNSGYGLGSFLNPQPQAPVEPTDEIGIKPEDYDVFERLLGEVQTAYSAEDRATLETRVTPEMLGYLGEEVADNVSRGVQAQLSGVKLLQGDLSEAWNEGAVDYATVALRYEIIDTVIDRNTKRVIEGDPNKAVEAVELWTFTRPKGTMNWTLSAIQQTDDQQA